MRPVWGLHNTPRPCKWWLTDIFSGLWMCNLIHVVSSIAHARWKASHSYYYHLNGLNSYVIRPIINVQLNAFSVNITCTYRPIECKWTIFNHIRNTISRFYSECRSVIQMKGQQDHIRWIFDSKHIEYREIDVASPQCADDKKFMQEILRKANPDVLAIPPQLFQDEAYRGVSSCRRHWIIMPRPIGRGH